MASPRFGVLLFTLFALLYCFLCKECTNVPSQLSSHTFRYELLSSKNKSRQESMYSSHTHLIPSDDSAWSSLNPIRMMREQEEEHLTAEGEFNWILLYRKFRHGGGNSPQNGARFLQEISLHKVRLDADSLHGKAQQTNLEYLLLLDVDNLVWSFRKTAGLPTPGSPYGGWESPDTELRGHFVGHYMSSSALMWASTHNEKLRQKMQAVVNALYKCQHKMGTGYLSAFPSELFDRFEAIQPVWAPYYTIHKIMAGLLDQYKLVGNARALKMVVWMAEYFYNRVQNVISKYTIERHWLSLNEETGGMNDVLYRLYTVTGDQRHLQLARRFDKPCFLGLLAVQEDSLSGFHANTHIPVVVGSQMRYEVTGDPLYKEIGAYFMDVVNSSHSYATGGTSVGEFWDDPKRLASTLETENEESCTTYNMLKVARHLFRWTKEMAYADYYERALINGILSIQRGREPGVMIYMLPLGRGASKSISYHGWGTKFDSFWCCYGTGIESFSKLGDSIYFQQGGTSPTLYVIQFISSTLTWDTAGLIVKQTVEPLSSWDPYLRVSMEFSKLKVGVRQNSTESTVNIRIPFWTTADGAQAMLNDEKLSLPYPGNFLTIARVWKTQDKLSLLFPVGMRTENIKDDRPQFTSIQAILFGPYLLAGMSNGDWDLIRENTDSFSEWITPVPGSFSSQLFSFGQEGKISSSSEVDNTTLVFTHSDNTISMEPFPMVGTDKAASATFRIIDSVAETSSGEYSSSKAISIMDFVGSDVYLEPFARPGMIVAHNGIDNNVAVINRAQLTTGEEHCSVGHCSPLYHELDAIFRVLPGLDGNDGSVSFESASLPSCFLYGSASYRVGQAVQLRCKTLIRDLEFNHSTSFTATTGIAAYHPISFIARGSQRAYLLAPLLSLRDESYTVYFNITS
eukprot:Gb_24309 [translate_table: standard]